MDITKTNNDRSVSLCRFGWQSTVFQMIFFFQGPKRWGKRQREKRRNENGDGEDEVVAVTAEQQQQIAVISVLSLSSECTGAGVLVELERWWW